MKTSLSFLLALFYLQASSQTISKQLSLFGSPYTEEGESRQINRFLFLGSSGLQYFAVLKKGESTSEVICKAIDGENTLKWKYSVPFPVKHKGKLLEVIENEENGEALLLFGVWPVLKAEGYLHAVKVEFNTGEIISSKKLLEGVKPDFRISKSLNQKYFGVNRNKLPIKKDVGYSRTVFDLDLNKICEVEISETKKFKPYDWYVSSEGKLHFIKYSKSQRNVILEVYSNNSLEFSIDGAQDLAEDSYEDFEIKLTANNDLILAGMKVKGKGEFQSLDVYKVDFTNKRFVKGSSKTYEKQSIKDLYAKVGARTPWEGKAKGPSKFKNYKIENIISGKDGSVFVFLGLWKQEELTTASGKEKVSMEANDIITIAFDKDLNFTWDNVIYRYAYEEDYSHSLLYPAEMLAYYNDSKNAIEVIYESGSKPKRCAQYLRIDASNGDIPAKKWFPSYSRMNRNMVFWSDTEAKAVMSLWTKVKYHSTKLMTIQYE